MLLFPVVASLPFVGAAPVDPNGAGRWRGGPAAQREPRTGQEAGDSPVTGAPAPRTGVASSWTEPASPPAGAASLGAGSCCAWPLSLSATCAREARRLFA